MVCFWVSSPYLLFPSDDTTYSATPWSSLWHPNPKPVYLGSVNIAKAVVSLFGGNALTGILLQSVVANSLILLVVGLCLTRLGVQRWIVGASLMIMATSPWMQVYHVMAGYAPTGALTFLLMIYAMLQYQLCESEMRTRWWLFAAGFASTLFLLSSSSAPLLIGLVGLSLLFIEGVQNRFRNGLASWVLFGLPALLAVIPYSIIVPLDWFQQNVDSVHYVDIARKMGWRPKPPSFLPVRTLYLYVPVVMLSLPIMGAFLVWRFPKLNWAPARRQCLVWLWLFLAVFFGLQELLPFTKMGRMQYAVFGIAVMLLGLSIQVLYEYRARWGWGALILVAGLSVGWGVRESVDLQMQRQSLPRALRNEFKGYKFLVMRPDPHYWRLAGWLDPFGIAVIESVFHFKEIMRKSGEKMALIVGPTGRNSGFSILNHCSWDDFNLDLEPVAQRQGLRLKRFPYYSGSPYLMPEEEVCHALSSPSRQHVSVLF